MERDDMDAREKDGKRERSGRKKERKRDRDGREKDIERGAGEREIGRVGETESGRERERDRGEKEGVTGEKEKKLQTQKKIMQFYLVVLYSSERSEARQWIVARQVSCYNPLSFFNPVTRDKLGKEMIERETGWERE